jgi:exopolyphosphatase / guanosine-5'-triphosphate,3'-diphosphate pyrophosphatase
MSALLAETLALRGRYDEEPSHSDQVSRLALELFDALKKWHGLDKRERELLHSAALLHDIGWSQTPDGKGHHKWSARLIREHGWKALEAEEVGLVAQIARYHRKTVPRQEHEVFQALDREGKKLVMILGGILRVADALDRTHSGRIERACGVATAAALEIHVVTRGKWEAERAMFKTKCDMLELAAGRAVKCVEKDGD